MSTFTDFVNTELPVRAAMLTNAIASYNGDPNNISAPPMVANAPIGTFFLQETGSILWQKILATPGNWQLVGSGGSGSVSGEDTFPSGATEYPVTIVGATVNSKIIISWLEDHGATRFWVVRAAGLFTVHLASAAAINTPFVWEIL